MNTTLSLNTTHPPDTRGLQTLQLPASETLRELTFTDRVQFRLGLWLLQRAQRPPRERRVRDVNLGRTLYLAEQNRLAAEREMLTIHLQRQLR